MTYDITARHPLYDEYLPSWKLMRDSADGEEKIKASGEVYLPMKSGTRAILDPVRQKLTYEAYKCRAEFPEIVAPTIRGTVGVMLKQSAKIELPAIMESLRERATLDGLALETLHRRIAVELMTTGRYGLLPGIKDGTPYLAGYIAESITNWDREDDNVNYVVLDETSPRRNLQTNKWETVTRYRECMVENGVFGSREWTKIANTGSDADWSVGEFIAAKTPRNEALKEIPFVFIGANDLLPEPDDVPLYGLARIAVRVYRLDADYTFTLHMSSEPTPTVSGYENPKQATTDGQIPTTIGSSVVWVLPVNGKAEFLEFSGASAEAQLNAITASLNRAIAFGAQVLTDNSRTAESGDALRIRYGNQTSLLHLVAINSAAGLEKALRNIAIWIGANPDEVKVEPNLQFFDEPLSSQDRDSIVKGWQAGAYSYPTMFARLQRGKDIPPDRTVEEEQELIAQDDLSRGTDSTPQEAIMLPEQMASQ